MNTATMLRPFTLLVKPTSADCNLRCEYCFYLEHCSFYAGTKRHRMSDAVLEQMIRTYMQTPQPQYSFGWQGGEPTLMGVDFFRRAVALQQQYGPDGAQVGNGVQTNGTLITPEMARLFSEYNFLLGVSLDGPPDIHDRHRIKVGGGGSHADVMKGIQHLRDHNAQFNILTLVNEANVKRPADVYHYLTENDFLFHQYIACVEPDKNRTVLPFSVSGKEWGDFLCTIFDLWYPGDTRRVSIRLFDSILLLLVDGIRNICLLGTNCCQYFVVEYNGDVYPCDFFVEKRLRLGNVLDDPWSVLQQSPVYRDFGQQKQATNPACTPCEYGWICQGGCLKHRLCANGGDPRHLSHLCEGWKQFYAHTLPRFKELAREIQGERMRHNPEAPLHNTPGRNEPCPCGSGRKYKHCCGKR